MLNYDLTDDQALLRNTVRAFAEAEMGSVIAELDEKEEFSYDLTRKMGELGLFGMTISLMINLCSTVAFLQSGRSQKKSSLTAL